MEAKLAAVRAAAEHPVDPATGRPFFQPAIGRAPHYRRNQHGLPVGDYLYGRRSALNSVCCCFLVKSCILAVNWCLCGMCMCDLTTPGTQLRAVIDSSIKFSIEPDALMHFFATCMPKCAWQHVVH